MPSTKKRLVHIISSLQRGGAENLLLMIIRHMSEFEHHVFYIHDGPINSDLTTLGVPTYRVRGLLAPYDPLGIYQLIRKIKQLKPTCIHTSLWAANLLGRIVKHATGIPVINSVHMGCEHEGKVRIFIDRLLMLKPSHTIAVSDHVAKSLQRVKRFDACSITVIQNGIDTELCEQQSLQNIPVIRQPHEFVIGAVGRFVKIKNYHLLLESVHELAQNYTNLRLVLIGTGPEEAALREQAAHLKITDRITWVINQSAYPYYRYFDCFVQPSAHEGGQSLALLEALYVQMPVVVTAMQSDGYHDVITNMANGLVIAPNDVAALTNALERLITHPNLCREFSNVARKIVLEKFTAQRTAQAYEALFNNYHLTDECSWP